MYDGKYAIMYIHDANSISSTLIITIYLSMKYLYRISAIRPELAFSRAKHSRPYSDVAKYIFDI